MSNSCRNKIFTITKCHLDKEDWPVGLLTEPPEPLPNHILKFKLFDDDRILYFEGVMVPTNTERLFYPLDTIGESYGCTEIQILNNKGEWETV